MTDASILPAHEPRSIDSEQDTTVLSCSPHQPNSRLSWIALRPRQSSFQAQRTSHSEARRLSHTPSWGVSNGSTDPDTSMSSAHPTRVWPLTSDQPVMISRCRSIEVDSWVDLDSRSLPSTRIPRMVIVLCSR